MNALGGELKVSARFPVGSVKIELFTEMGEGKAGSLQILGGFGNDQIGARTFPADGLARLCPTGLVARTVSMKGFTFEMILVF